MRTHHGRVLALALVAALAGCTTTSGNADTPASVEPSVPSVAPASPSKPAASFPIAAFADISEEPVSDATAAEFRAILSDMAGEGGWPPR
jgi:hypothetical protein